MNFNNFLLWSQIFISVEVLLADAATTQPSSTQQTDGPTTLIGTNISPSQTSTKSQTATPVTGSPTASVSLRYILTTSHSPTENTTTTAVLSTTASMTSTGQPLTSSTTFGTPEPQQVEIERIEGESIDLSCPVDINEASVTWHKQKEDSFEELKSKSPGNKYLIVELTQDHSGVYRCIVVTETGETTADVILTVLLKATSLHSKEAAVETGKKAGLPKYSGIAIGLAICLALLLLSGAAVFLLNFTSNGGLMFCMGTACGPPQKEDISSLSRLAAERGSNRKSSQMKVLPLQRMHTSASHDG